MKFTPSQHEVLSAMHRLNIDTYSRGVMTEDIALMLRKRISDVSQLLNRLAGLGAVRNMDGQWFFSEPDHEKPSPRPQQVEIAASRQITSFRQAQNYSPKRMSPMRPGADDHLQCPSRRGDAFVPHTHIMPIGSRAFPDVCGRK